MQFKRVPRNDLKVGDTFKLMLDSVHTYVVLETNTATGKIRYKNLLSNHIYYTYDVAHAYIEQAKVYPQRSRKI